VDKAAGRRFGERLDRRALEEEMERCGVVPMPEEAGARFSHLRHCWFWGSQAFAEAALKLAKSALERPRHRTTMSHGSLAERLRMGSAANVSQKLRRGRDGASQVKLPAQLRRLVEECRVGGKTTVIGSASHPVSSRLLYTAKCRSRELRPRCARIA
jgi:hypothetical protein